MFLLSPLSLLSLSSLLSLLFLLSLLSLWSLLSLLSLLLLFVSFLSLFVSSVSCLSLFKTLWSLLSQVNDFLPSGPVAALHCHNPDQQDPQLCEENGTLRELRKGLWKAARRLLRGAFCAPGASLGHFGPMNLAAQVSLSKCPFTVLGSNFAQVILVRHQFTSPHTALRPGQTFR